MQQSTNSTIVPTEQVSSSYCVARVHLRGADFAVYDAAMALTARSTSKRILSASTATLARMTGYSERTCGFARCRLVDQGWFVPVGDNWKAAQRRTGAAGTFRTPEFEVLDHLEWAKRNTGKCPTGYLSTVYGEGDGGSADDGGTGNAGPAPTDDGRTTGTDDGRRDDKALQSLSLKEMPSKKNRSHFENRKMTDPRFSALRDTYIAEFEKGSPGVKAPFEARDAKMLSDLLKRQGAASSDDLIAWLKNAFASEVTFPLQLNFRMREFCSHAEKFAKGPLLKRAGAPIPVRSAASSATESDRLDDLVV
jgi:hypothetical protein